jgi:deoxyribodipyrimidine photo-lyase
MTQLPAPSVGDEAAWVAHHLDELCGDDAEPSPRFRGTQAAADAAIAAYDVGGYARMRNEVLPVGQRGASGLSPWIRHGLITLRRAWAAVEGGPTRDVEKFRDELLWQEYARHLYARLGSRTQRALRAGPASQHDDGDDPWDRSMACMSLCLDELERDGWLVNQTRMWLASQWTVRHGADWREGEDRFFTHLLDGSRAANRLGWQWTIGAGTGKAYGFSRWQVEKRAPGLCVTCQHASACPIQHRPRDEPLVWLPREPLLDRDPLPARTAGPPSAESTGVEPEAVWITAESLGDDDPALAGHPELPVVFVFDQSLLARLRLSRKRMVFLAERLAEIGTDRTLTVHLGDPVVVIDVPVAATFTPVPGWRRIATRVPIAVEHPWPWLRRPEAHRSLRSFTAWNDRPRRRR